MIRKITVMACGVLMMMGCSSNNCPLDNNVTCNYHFYDINGKATMVREEMSIRALLPGTKTVYTYRKLGSQTMVFDQPNSWYTDEGYTETVSTVRRDTLLANRLTGAKSVKIPMSYGFGTNTNGHSADTLIVSYSNITRNDTLVVAHEAYAHIETPECGTYYYHHLLTATSTDAAIDHCEIINPLVDYEGKENIRIYFNNDADD